MLSKIFNRDSANQNLGHWLTGLTVRECKSKYCILLKRSSNGESDVKCCLLKRHGLGGNMSFRKGQQSDQEMEIHAHMKTPNTKMLLHISNIKAFLPSAEPI
jgi:hypothetical protein